MCGRRAAGRRRGVRPVRLQLANSRQALACMLTFMIALGGCGDQSSAARGERVLLVGRARSDAAVTHKELAQTPAHLAHASSSSATAPAVRGVSGDTIVRCGPFFSCDDAPHKPVREWRRWPMGLLCCACRAPSAGF